MNEPPPSFKNQISRQTIAVLLVAVDTLTHGGTAVANSALQNDSRRIIRIDLNRGNLLVDRALRRTDALTLRFLTCLALVEFCTFWGGQSNDGKATTRAIRKIADLEKGAPAWGTGFASKLAASEELRSLDKLPIFGTKSSAGPFELFTFEANLRSPSDVAGWQPKGGA